MNPAAFTLLLSSCFVATSCGRGSTDWRGRVTADPLEPYAVFDVEKGRYVTFEDCAAAMKAKAGGPDDMAHRTIPASIREKNDSLQMRSRGGYRSANRHYDAHAATETLNP